MGGAVTEHTPLEIGYNCSVLSLHMKLINNHPHEINNPLHEIIQRPHGINNHPQEINKHPHEIVKCPHGINNHPHEIVKRPHGINNHPQEINKTANEFTGSFDTDNAPYDSKSTNQIGQQICIDVTWLWLPFRVYTVIINC